MFENVHILRSKDLTSFPETNDDRDYAQPCSTQVSSTIDNTWSHTKTENIQDYVPPFK